jgi:hypothetical protein
LFQDDLELNFKLLDKKFTIDDGDFSCCPPQYLSEIKSLLNDFNERFSKSKLDIETTDIYTAELPTLPNRKVNQLVRRLPHHKALFALKAINQLKQAGVIRDSDSPWRSNVVLVPKPTSSNELHQNTKVVFFSTQGSVNDTAVTCTAVLMTPL